MTSEFPSGLSQPALRALAGAGYTRLDQLTSTTEKELLKLHGMGPKGTRILREALTAQGLDFSVSSTPRKDVSPGGAKGRRGEA